MAEYLRLKGRQVLANGYNIIPIYPGDKAASIKNWQRIETTESDFNGWMSNGRASHGLGITTKWTPFADFDVQDIDMCVWLRKTAEFVLGYAPIRIGNAPKFGMVYRTEEPFTKVSSAEFIDSQGRKAQVEFLGDGQQFVAYHIHPDTKKPYAWPDGETPENTPAADLSTINRGLVERFIKMFEEEAERHGWQRKRRETLPAVQETPGFIDDPDYIGHEGTEPLGLTDEELRAKVELIPNDDAPYEGWGLTWFNMLAAIAHETEKSPEGYEIALSWSEKSGKHEIERFNKTWNSFGKGDRRPVTAKLIIQEALKYEKAAKQATIDDLVGRMDFASSVEELKTIAMECSKIETDLIDRARLAGAMQTHMKRVARVALPIRDAREMVKYRPNETDWLKDWVYLSQSDRFFNTSDKRMLLRIAFDSLFGRFMPADSSVTPSFHALNKEKIPTFDVPIYMPTEGPTFKYNGKDAVNLYSDSLVPPIPAIIRPADARAIGLVKDHISNICPTERDMSIILSWLRYISLYRDRPNWAVVIQGPGGDGKTMIGGMMAGILGSDNVYMLASDTLESAFNAWSHGHLLAIIEEILVPGHKWSTLNRVKPLITNPVNELHGKGRDPYNVPNTQAYLAFTNHRDALPVDDTDRRYYITMSRWRDSEALAEYMADKPNYFPDLAWAMDNHAGALRGWLHNLTPHPEFSAKGRAPYSHGRQQMAAINKPEDAETLTELLKSNRYENICNRLVVVSALISHLYGDDILPKNFGPRIRKLLSELGFDYLGRVRIEGVQESVWSKTPEEWPSDSSDLGRAINKWLNRAL